MAGRRRALWYHVLQRWFVAEPDPAALKMPAAPRLREEVFRAPDYREIMVQAGGEVLCGDYLIATEEVLVVDLDARISSAGFADWEEIVTIEVH